MILIVGNISVLQTTTLGVPFWIMLDLTTAADTIKHLLVHPFI